VSPITWNRNVKHQVEPGTKGHDAELETRRSPWWRGRGPAARTPPQSVASAYLMDHMPDAAGLKATVLRQTRIADLAHRTDARLVASAFGMAEEDAVCDLTDAVNHGGLRLPRTTPSSEPQVTIQTKPTTAMARAERRLVTTTRGRPKAG
jgi:hypothetical protein